MITETIFWVIFSAIIIIILLIDLFVTDHRRGTITLKASLLWSGIWIIAALIFNVFLYFYLEDGQQKAIEFLTGYIIEKSLSVDNLFVFLMIFTVMGISPENQPHILKWGIIGAIVFRIIFILAGVALINFFHPIIYLFAIILMFAAYKMAFTKEHKIDPEKNLLIRFFTKNFRLDSNYRGKKFFLKNESGRFITIPFLTLLLIESSDIVFAVDSIPAIIAITRDTFIIISSNIFAILGLRALYFALSGLVEIFRFLKYGVAVVLFYVGIKMLISDFYKIPTEISLLVIILTLSSSILLSLIRKKKFVN